MRVSVHIRCGCLCLAAVLGLGPTARGEETFPYRLTVAAAGVTAHSGPGDKFYPTDPVPVGTEIEVYRHHADGWLGIRPPAGSFSWVRREQLATGDKPLLGRVLQDDTICRVGSVIAEVPEHVGQVYLERDEWVETLTGGGPSTETARQLESQGWCRIAPPAGEFRWVRRADLERRPPAIASARGEDAETGAAAAPDRGSPVRLAADWQVTSSSGQELSTVAVLQAVAQQATEEAKPPGEPPANSQPQAPPAPGAPPNEPVDEPPANQPPTGFSVPVPREQSGDAPAGELRPRWSPRGRLSPDEVLEIDFQLSQMVSQDIRNWRFEPLRQRLETLLPRLKPHTGQAEAEHLLERITAFEQLQNRFAHPGAAATAAGAPATASPGGPILAAGVPVEDGARFDGTGWLVPVHSTRRPAPPYALLDAEGEVLQYVSPAPGLNLHRYLRKQVGIHGQRGISATWNKSHLTAERIVDLSRHQR